MLNLCEHVEVAERFQKYHPNDPVYSYGKRVFFKGKNFPFQCNWYYCPMCGQQIRQLPKGMNEHETK